MSSVLWGEDNDGMPSKFNMLLVNAPNPPKSHRGYDVPTLQDVTLSFRNCFNLFVFLISLKKWGRGRQWYLVSLIPLFKDY